MPQPALPAELIRVILQLVNGEGHAYKNQATLARCCLISTAILPLAREELYRSVGLYQSYDTCDTVLIRTIADTPHIAACVQSLDFAYWAADPMEPSSPSGQETMTEVTAACCNVRRIHITSSEDGVDSLRAGEILEAIGSSTETLETLSLDGFNTWWPRDLATLLSSFSRLKHLKIAFLHHPHSLQLATPPTFQLQSLEARQLIAPAVFSAILQNSTNSLRSLAIFSDADYAALALERFTNLRKITLHWRARPSRLSLIPPLDLLNLCTHLKSLELALGADARHRLPHMPLDTLRLLRLLPPALTSLSDAGWLSLDTETLLSIFPHRHLLPNLRHFHVPIHERIAEGGWRRRSKEAAGLVEEAAARKGVTVQWWNTQPRARVVDE